MATPSKRTRRSRNSRTPQPLICIVLIIAVVVISWLIAYNPSASGPISAFIVAIVGSVISLKGDGVDNFVNCEAWKSNF